MKMRVKQNKTKIIFGSFIVQAIHCSNVVVSNVKQHIVRTDLVKCVEDSLSISVVGVEGFGFLDGDDWLFKLLKPCPHEPSEDKGIPLHTQPFPATALVHFCLHTFGSRFRPCLPVCTVPVPP